MQINIRSLWFILDRRFTTDCFPYEAYTSKQEALRILMEMGEHLDTKPYHIEDFEYVERQVLNNAKK